jgi:hypothetical protein
MRGPYNNNRDDYSRVECQLCGKKGHTVMKCFKRFDQNYTGEEKSTAAATSYNMQLGKKSILQMICRRATGKV